MRLIGSFGATAVLVYAVPQSERHVFTPVLVGVLILVLVAVVLNNLPPVEGHRYPACWF